MTRTGPRLARMLSASAILLLPFMALAQTYYKWTDAQGTVHLSDQPPPGAHGVEERRMAPPVVSNEDSGRDRAESGSPAPGPSPGAVRLEVQGFHATRTGPASMHASGAVRNAGGGVAEDVVVVLTADDPVQGNPCFESEVIPRPARLAAGDLAIFDVDVADPCLNGEAKLEAKARWSGSARESD